MFCFRLKSAFKLTAVMELFHISKTFFFSLEEIFAFVKQNDFFSCNLALK